MGLSQSLYTGYTGLYTHQKSMDNISNNLANVNTPGYKKNDFMFSTIWKKALTGAMPAEGPRTSVNPKNVGLGVRTGAILPSFQQGPAELTGDPFDLTINGNGFFLVRGRQGLALTRVGSFYMGNTSDPNQRQLLAGDGLAVQGWMAQGGVVTPSQTVGNIFLPQYGSVLQGKTSANVAIGGVLPTRPSSADTAGGASTTLELNGNMTPSGQGNTLRTHIFSEVTTTNPDGTATKAVQEIPVELAFTGPTLSDDGATNNYAWTMTTVDWPQAGAPGVQIYPAAGGSTPSPVKFYTTASVEANHGAGEIATPGILPGASRVSVETRDADGNLTTRAFAMPSDFNLELSRLTNLAEPPVAGGLSQWYVNGNPSGTYPTTVSVYDEFTVFEAVTDAAGVTTMQAVRTVEPRSNTLYFNKSEVGDDSTTWTWKSSAGDATGTLVFNTGGELASQAQSGGKIAYDFSKLQYVNQEGSLMVTADDGYPDGELTEITFDANGRIIGNYDNDTTQVLAMIALGTVPNTSGLSSQSGTLFFPTVASGQLMIGVAGDATTNFGIPQIGAGSLTTGELESSNVNLSQEFTNLISTERGFQFNSKVVTTSDEMIQTALNLKR